MGQTEERERSMEAANSTGNYTLILWGVVIGMIGVFARFAFDSTTLSIASWAILLIGSIVACKGVFKILDAK